MANKYEHISRQLAHEMEELGFTLNSNFMWQNVVLPGGKIDSLWALGDRTKAWSNYIRSVGKEYESLVTIPAYTVGELAQLLPSCVVCEKKISFLWVKFKIKHTYHLKISIDCRGFWRVSYSNKHVLQEFSGALLADAMGVMLIYLAKEGLINPAELKL